MTWDLTQPALQEKSSEQDARFSFLVSRQTAFVFRLAYGVVRNGHDAEDVTQETLLKLYLQSTPTVLENERAYLARIAWRLATSRLHPQIAPVPEQMPSTAATPEQNAAEADWHGYRHQMIASLPEELRHPLQLSMADLKSNEIAEVLSIPEGTVRNRLLRARHLLKQKLAPALESRYGR